MMCLSPATFQPENASPIQSSVDEAVTHACDALRTSGFVLFL